MNPRRFKDFLCSEESDDGDVPYYTEQRCSGHGRMLKQVYEFMSEIRGSFSVVL
jgi:hypothetical protein